MRASAPSTGPDTDLPIPLTAYRLVTRALLPFAPAILRVRAGRGKEDWARRCERLGRPSAARPPGPLLWLHGASIGEGLSLLPLAAALRAQDFSVLLTTGTRAGAQVLPPRLPPGVIHQYAPLDLAVPVERFLHAWQPAALLLAESELWPNTLAGCAARAIPIVIVGARMSDRSYRRWRRLPNTARTLFGRVSLCLAQSAQDATRFADLGTCAGRVTGSLKTDGTAPPADPAALAGLRAAVGERPVVVATSTHREDERAIFAAHRALRDAVPDLLTIVVPRDPTRGREVATAAARLGLRVARRSDFMLDSRTLSDADVLVADTFGETGLWLRGATVAVIGKTFGSGGGQTPLEAAGCGVPILHGSSVHAFADTFAALDACGGALPVEAAALAAALAALLRDPDRRRTMAGVASEVLRDLSGGTARTLDALEPLLAPLRPFRAA